jgi:hypothetical protein
VHAADINDDGVLDILGVAYHSWELLWWDLDQYTDGILESSILDTECYPDWEYISWDASTPQGTTVSIAMRASEDYLEMGGWSDPVSVPCALEGILGDSCRYLQYRVILDSFDSESTPILNSVSFSWNQTGLEEAGNAGPVLYPFTPNPSSAPVVRFNLPEPAAISLDVVDISGRAVHHISGLLKPSGEGRIHLDDMLPGVYFCRITAGDFTALQTLVVVE